MAYTKITIKRIVKRGKFDAPSLKFRVTETHDDGQWSGGGSLFDVHEVDGFFVCLSPWNQAPLYVISSSLEELKNKLRLKTKCTNIVVE